MAENLQSSGVVIGDGADTLRAELYCPDVQFEELYSRIALVREAVGYKDGKAVADCEPIGGHQEVARRLQVGALATEADLINFWHVNFRSPAYADNVKGVTCASSGLPLGTYLTEMWPRLTYHEKKDRGTLLATPNPRLKPGERFAEGYYWDTADGLEGLMVEADQSPDNWRQVFGELRNFAATIERFGFIPNGMRSYYLSRSQPPRIRPYGQEGSRNL